MPETVKVLVSASRRPLEEASVANSLVAVQGISGKPVRLFLDGKALLRATQIITLRSKQVPGVEFRLNGERLIVGGISGRRVFINGACYTVQSANDGFDFVGPILEVTYDPATDTIS